METVETKKCKHCTKDIPKKATKCPECHGDLRSWASRHPLITIVLFLFVLGTIISSLGEENTNQPTSNSNTASNTLPVSGDDSSTEPTTQTKVPDFWIKSFFVDDFGDATEESYVANIQPIAGTFSNSATQDSKLNVNIITKSPNEIQIMLYEYASNNPVKAYSTVDYNLYVKDGEGNKYEMKAVNQSDRLIVQDSNKLHNIFIKGGEVVFVIKEIDTPTEYNFTVYNFAGYNNNF